MHRPTPRSLRFLAAPAVGVLGLVLLGCSDDGDAIDPDADQDLVEEVTLTLDDLPDGFEEVDAESDDDNEIFDECGDEVDIDPDDIEENKVAEAGDDVRFTLESADSFTQVQASVTSFRDGGLARRQLAAFDDDDFFDCVVDGLGDRLAEGGEITDLEVERGDPAADGDAAAAVEMTFVSSGFEFEVQMQSVVVDRFGIVLQVLSGPDGVDDDLVDDTLDAMLDRLEDARE